MAITDASRLYGSNFRNKRRFLQGHGVNLRETVVESAAVYAADRILVPGLQDDDDIISVVNMDALVDVTGYLDVEGDKAAVTIFTVNKGIVFTAKQAGPEGNKIDVRAAAAPGNSLPLSAKITPSTITAGRTIIDVFLATNSSGVALTTGANDASLVLAAILAAMNVPPGGNGHIVTMALTGDGTTDWTAQAITPLTGGASFRMGPTSASLLVDPPGALNAIRYASKVPGADGNSASVAYTAGGALAVAVTGSPDDNIVVTYVDTVTTAQEVVDAVNAHAEAKLLVAAANASGSDGSGAISDDVVATPLAGGVDAGIRLTEDSSGVNLKVLWLSRSDVGGIPVA